MILILTSWETSWLTSNEIAGHIDKLRFLCAYSAIFNDNIVIVVQLLHYALCLRDDM